MRCTPGLPAMPASGEVAPPADSGVLEPSPAAELMGRGARGEVVVLAVFAGGWGLLYGVIINLWFWPFLTGLGASGWAPGLSLAEGIKRYALYYLVTSLVWDAMRVLGNAALVAVFGAATLRALRRFQARFQFTYLPGGHRE